MSAAENATARPHIVAMHADGSTETHTNIVAAHRAMMRAYTAHTADGEIRNATRGKSYAQLRYVGEKGDGSDARWLACETMTNPRKIDPREIEVARVVWAGSATSIDEASMMAERALAGKVATR